MTDQAKANRSRNDSAVPTKFDKKIAILAMKGFSKACDVPCSLFSEKGVLIDESGKNHSGCSFCKAFFEKHRKDLPCTKLHSYGAFEAERIGGRYIYSCPAGLVFISSPIMFEGSFAGFMTAGPIGMPDVDDVLEAKIYEPLLDDSIFVKKARQKIAEIRCAEPSTVEALSTQLFSTCLYVSDSMHEMYLAKKNAEHESILNETSISLKHSGDNAKYPNEVETELFYAVSEGNQKKAGELLNSLLGYIFFYYKSKGEMQARVAQLFTVLSRAAVAGGANSEYILTACDSYLMELQEIPSTAYLSGWMATRARRFIDLIFEMVNGKYSKTINYAVSYINENCTEKLSLEIVAEIVGYSPTYFSKLFKEEMGESFKAYLIKQRIERSKFLLLSTKIPMTEVCARSGFSDQSYFCKMFRESEGITPDKFRKHMRHIDASKERSKE